MCLCVWFNIIHLLSVSYVEIIDTIPYGELSICQCVHENISNVGSIHKLYDYRQTYIRMKNQCTYIDMSRIQILIFITTNTCWKFDTHSYVLQLPLIKYWLAYPPPPQISTDLPLQKQYLQCNGGGDTMAVNYHMFLELAHLRSKCFYNLPI